MIRFDYSDKIALVTGASQGIGLGIARALHTAGADVHITGTRETAADYDDDLTAFHYHRARLDRRDDRAALRSAIPAIDILINNAGMARDDEYELEGFLETIDVNLNAPVELCYLFHDVLRARSGTIVNIGSGASFVALRQNPAYTASKTGLLGFTRAVADKWSRDGVRVNLVAPGFIDTRMADWTRENDGEKTPGLLRVIPAGRLGTVDEVATVALFLASPQAGYIIGQGVVVDGGLLLR